MSEEINKNANFSHLHNHTFYSLLDGYSSPEDMAKTAAVMGFKSLAITDHGSCAGMLAFQKACIENNIKPILGQEFYSTEDHKYQEKDSKTYHLVLLAKNAEGTRNLMKLSTLGELEGKYKKPRIDFSLLEKYHTGLICTTACCAGEIPIKIYDGKESEAEEITKKYKSLFGDDFYIEIMMHKYFPEKNDQGEREKLLARKLYDLAKRNGIKAIATNDCHYATKSDFKYQDILLSMQTLANMKDPDRFTFGSDDFYLKPYDEMMRYFGNAPELLTNTLEIAEKIEKDSLLQVSKDLLPNFDVPKGYVDEVEYLKALVKDGMRSKGLINKPEYRDRIKFEMKAIIECGYVRYFLVLWDIINWTRQQGIRIGCGRGSAAGSLALFVIGITGIDPIKYNLLFERFINPERVSPPDVDIDFDYYRRDEVRDYVVNKYGQDYCSKIGTYNTLKPRSSIRYGAKALDIGNDWEAYQKAISNANGKSIKFGDFKRSLELADFIAKQIPFGPNETIETALQQSEDFKNCMSKYPLLLDACRHVEGNLVSSGVHAAGIVVCKNKVADHVPMRLNKGQVCTQLDKNEVEELGLLKFDFLALKTLTVIERTLEMIKKRYGKTIDIDNIDDYDPKLFKLLNGGYNYMDNRGIFQFENFGMSKLLKNIRVDSFKDMAIASALYRPGPLGAGVHDLFCDMKHGRKKNVSLHPKMNEILKETYGCMVFQENFMKVAQVLAGFTKGQSDTLRKYVGKKKPEALKEMRVKFVEGCLKTNIDVSEDIANKIFDQIEFFGGYGFNASHSYAYSFLSLQTMYLKVYYPLEFMCNLLTSEIDNTDKNEKLDSYIKEATRMGITVKQPDLNKSSSKFVIEKGISQKTGSIGTEIEYIRSPFTILDGVGEKAVDEIVLNQPYADLRDFLFKVNLSKVNVKVYKSMINCGCMEECWGMVNAEKLLDNYEKIRPEVEKAKKEIKKEIERTENYEGTLFDVFGDSEIKL